MNKIELPYQETGYFSKLMSDYLDEKEELKPFYNHYCDVDAFGKAIEERKQFPIDREVLVDALTQQYKGLEISEQVKTNIQKLNNNNCFTVTTGHQLNLFTGPLYFIYKIVSTINLAKVLKEKYPKNDFVPVYWMATEDHDFEEVNHFNLFNKRYELTKNQAGAVGKMKLEGVEELFSALNEDLGDRNGITKILELFSKFYTSNCTYAEATRGIVNHFFENYGLVTIDGDDRELKKLFADDMEWDFIESRGYRFVQKISKQIIELGHKPQVNPRECNLFYLVEGRRERLIHKGNGEYEVLNSAIKFTTTEILFELEKYPERFSPNVILRPMYQEKILPNLAYIGGGGELAYWFQLKEMFDVNNIFFPTLILRNSVLFVDGGSNKRLTKLGLTPIDLFKGTEVLIKEYLKKGADIVLDLKKEEEDVIAVFEDIIQKSGEIDQSLQPFVKAELQKNIKSLKNIENRLIKAEKKKEEVAVNQIQNLKEKLFPKSSLQERHDNLISILLFYGDGIIDELIENLHPLDKQFIILTAE